MADDDAGDVVNDFEAWARISVRLHERDESFADHLLVRLGLSEVWDNADATWAKTLANEMKDMRLDRTRRYAALLAEELQERRLTGAGGGDFRHRATFGPAEPSRPSAVRQIGGTPFSTDPGDREATRRMRPVDARALSERAAPTETLTAVRGPVEPPPDDDRPSSSDERS